tara:strand:- start:762 stop:962 length:201 start_codon:yes stop_codon:yes gene_type:complete
MLFKEFRESLKSQPIAIKKIGDNVVIFKEGDKYKVQCADQLLDEDFDNILEAEEAGMDFLKLLEED